MSNFVVIDASFALRAILPDRLTTKAREKLGDWHQEGRSLRAPTLWYYETTSALSKLVRFKELTWQQASQAVKLALDLQVELTPPTVDEYRAAWRWTEKLNRAASYDSFYLASAERSEAELWTADKRLYNAVQEPWVHLLG